MADDLNESSPTHGMQPKTSYTRTPRGDDASRRSSPPSSPLRRLRGGSAPELSSGSIGPPQVLTERAPLGEKASRCQRRPPRHRH